MKSLWILSIVFCLIANNAYGDERQFEPLPRDGQKLEYQDGEAVTIASTPRAVVMISLEVRDKKTALAKIAVLNTSQESFNISDRSVSAASNGVLLSVMSYADRQKELRRHEAWSSFAAGLSAAANNINASNAGNRTQYGTYTATTNAYGSGGGYATANTYGTYQSSTYDQGAVQRAQLAANEQNQRIFDRRRAKAEYERLDLEARALKANTISPGETVVGDVRFSLPKKAKDQPASFVFGIEVAGEPVLFFFQEVN